MNESRPSSCPKIFISNELETSPFFYPIVNQALGQIRSWPVGRALLKAIAHSMPTVRGTGVRGFCVGANVTIHPLPDTVTFVRRNYRLPTDTADTMANNRNAFINLTQQNHFRETTANTLRMGGGNCHTALDQAAAGDGRGSATIIYFSNAIRAQQSGLPAPPFVGLAHELIHAMHALAGDKKATTQEEEQRTVWLAAYAKEAICENALRQDASLPLRLRY